MDLEWLRRFVTVADTLSFRRAATQLGISQPTLSRSLNLLEESVGTRLLQRDRRGDVEVIGIAAHRRHQGRKERVSLLRLSSLQEP